VLNGKDFRARERLTSKAGDVLAEIGETCDRVPDSSLGWLERCGHIERVPRPSRRRELSPVETPAATPGEE
jgi:hypothetical protein